MSASDILGLVFVFIGLTGLLVLLFIICVPLAKVEKSERESRNKLYKTITKYLEDKMSK